jgi:hypothetical protein
MEGGQTVRMMDRSMRAPIAREMQYLPLVRTEQINQGRRPPKWQLVQVTGTRCSTGVHPAASKLRTR